MIASPAAGDGGEAAGAMLRACEAGPRGARVDDVAVTERSGAETFAGFEVRAG